MHVLSIDGGGIRGLIPAIVLAEIETRTQRRIHSLFGLIAGTSTGGIIAAALTRPKSPGSTEPYYTAAELTALYESEGPKIFHRDLLKRIFSFEGWIDERYESDGLRAALNTYLGDARLRDTLAPILVTAYEIEDRLAFFFRSSRAQAEPARDFFLADVAHATSAAPTYFEPVVVRDTADARSYALIDGGVFATNPSMCAFAELARAGQASEIDVLLSLGTGSQTRPLNYGAVRSWGQLEWARKIVDVVFDGAADIVDFQLEHLLGDDNYVRLQTQLNGASDDMDDATPANLRALRREAELLIERESGRIDDVCARLVR